MKWEAEVVVPSRIDGDILWFEDGGQHLRCLPLETEKPSSNTFFSVELRSYQPDATRQDKKAHTVMRGFMGKRVRITIEEIEEDE